MKPDVLHLTFTPPAEPGSYNRWVGCQMREISGLRQLAVSYGREERMGKSSSVIYVNDSEVPVWLKLLLALPEGARAKWFNGIGGRKEIVYAWRVMTLLPLLRPRLVICYDGYKLGSLLRKVIDWPCRLVLSQHGLSYFLEGSRRNSVYGFGVFDAVWTLSRASYEVDKAGGHSYEPIVQILPNGVDIDSFRPVSDLEREKLRADWGLPNNGSIVLLVSRLIPKKGAHVIVHSWRRILEQFPEAYLWVVGVGDAEYEKHLRRQVRVLGVEKRVRFEGAVSPSLVASCYRAADVYAFPTLCAEGMALTLLEAMSCGVPCVTSEYPSARALYRDQDVIFVEAPNIEDAFVEPIVRVLRCAELRRRLGASARETVVNHYSEAKALERIREFYIRQLSLLDQ